MHYSLHIVFIICTLKYLSKHYWMLLREFTQCFFNDSNFNVTSVSMQRTIHPPRSTLYNILFLWAIYVIKKYSVQYNATIFLYNI